MLVALLGQQVQPLAAARRYAALTARLPKPGPFNNTTVFVHTVRNMTDETTVVRVATAWEFVQDASQELFGSRCYGDYGELCFRIPEKYHNLANDPRLSSAQRQALLAAPVVRTLYTGGIGVVMAF